MAHAITAMPAPRALPHRTPNLEDRRDDMTVRPVLVEEPLVNLLAERDPALLGLRRLFALNVLQQIGTRRLCAQLSPDIAEAVLDATRLGGVETAPEWALTQEAIDRLAQVREALSTRAFQGERTKPVQVLVPGRRSWQPITVSLPDAPDAWPAPMTVLVDHGRHRNDGPFRAVDEVVGDSTHTRGKVAIVRTRLDDELEDTVGAVRYGLDVAIGACARRRSGQLPRAAVVRGVERAGAWDLLPFDVRLAFVHQAAPLPPEEDGWRVFEHDQLAEAARAHRDGELVCVRVRSVESATTALLAFEWPPPAVRLAETWHAEVA